MRPPYPIIDAHVHIAPWEQVLPDAAALMSAGREDFEIARAICRDPHRLVAEMDKSGIEKLVMINYVTPDVVGFTEAANEFSARMAKPYPERLIPFGGIDPRRVPDVAAEMDHLLGDLGLGGIKLHPPHQFFRTNDYLNGGELRGLATVYEKCIEYGVPVMVHTGTSVFPRARNKYADPMDLDDVIVDFPELKLIIAHGGRPLWMDATFFLLRRSPNVFLDISSVPPKRLLEYFPWIERVADQAMFGSDWPGPGVKDLSTNIEDFYNLPLSDEAKHQILRDTAQKLFARNIKG
jgi:predicted TIM-barrel fold metal-dependent hydrolase